LIVDQVKLEEARNNNDVTSAQEILQDAYRTELRPLLREARIRKQAALDPIKMYREFQVRKNLVRERRLNAHAAGL